MNEQKYVIAWKSKLTGAEGQGTTLYEKRYAESFVHILNTDAEHCDLIHCAKPVNSPEIETEKSNV